MKRIVIAIDGFSSCGKSTMAKDLARQIGYTYVDTGAMYRAVTLYCLRNKLFTDGKIDEAQLQAAINDIHITLKFNPTTGKADTWLNGKNVEQEIRTMEVSQLVSIVAAIGFARHHLVSQQQELGKEKGIVMDGRDIGTVVFPNAELKIFVTARPEVRAQRRLAELQAKGEKTTFEEVLENVRSRDHLDMTRAESPLRKAEDAIELDNSDITIDEQNKILIGLYNNKVKS